MKKKRSELFSSIISLLLCVSMLVGTTFAWFTDSVTSGINTIAAGNLDVDVYYGDPADENSIEGMSSLYQDVKLWEPGVVAYENLTVANKGTLALKYQMGISFGSENYVMEDGVATYGLSDILKVAIVNGGVEENLTREQLIASIPETEWIPIDNFVLTGELLANTNDETVGIVIWWQPSEDDNNWNLNNGKVTSDEKDYLHIELGVSLVATQYTYEKDSFDENYDLNAVLPEIPSKWIPEGLELNKGAITVFVPKGAPAGEYTLEVNSFEKNVDKSDHAVINLDITLTKDGVAVEPGSALYTVLIACDPMSEGHEITHNGEPVTNYSYDIFYNGVMFATTSFSPFRMEYDVFGVDVKLDSEARTIQSGLFAELDSANPDNYNPLKLDPTLDSTEAESVAVSYDVDGVKHYAVSDRDTTVFVGDADDGGVTADFLTFLNGAAEVKMVNDNTLCETAVLKLNEFDHGTLYILPGTYQEQRRLDVYSSMNIIGLGKVEEIRLIKVGTTSTKSSHQHLINCNGAVTREDHIEVTIRNLSLDATAGNGKYGFTDNGAVQSIRMSKVKCHDLIVTDKGMASFYVNGRYDTRGAYLYAEHCVTNNSNAVTTSGTYCFHYYNMAYGKGIYTNNTTYIKNQLMESSDWEW